MKGRNDMMKPIEILLVEDDPSMGYLLQDNLEMAGYRAVLCTDGSTAFPTYSKGNFDLLIVDVMLPYKDGFTFAKEIRELDTEIPIVFLTARDRKEDRVKGFRIGADDYITKPFSIEEFLLRIKAILKRTGSAGKEANLPKRHQLGNYHFDVKNQQLSNEREVHQLTYREAKLLDLFCRHANQLLTRDLIMQAIWESEGVQVGRSLDVFVSRLRKFFKEEPDINIANIHGVGYRLEV